MGLTRQKTFTMTSFGLGCGDLNKNGVESLSLSPVLESDICKDELIEDCLKSERKTHYRIDETPQKIESDEGTLLKKYIQKVCVL